MNKYVGPAEGSVMMCNLSTCMVCCTLLHRWFVLTGVACMLKHYQNVVWELQWTNMWDLGEVCYIVMISLTI